MAKANISKHEMRVARLQTNELGRADGFFGSLLSKENIRENEQVPIIEAPKAPLVNGSALPFRTDTKPRFSDPPAPPPQQPLPEKPDIARSHEPSSPSLKRSNTERPKSVPNVSPIRQEPTSQILTLIESLTSARKEIETQSAKLRDMEEMLQKERHAREVAEETAKRLELQSEARANGHLKEVSEGSVIEDAFEPPSEVVEYEIEQPLKLEPEPEPKITKEIVVDHEAITNSTALLEKRLETMLVDMQEMRDQMELFKIRAETAEKERDVDRITLAEMVEKIKADEVARIAMSAERASTPTRDLAEDGTIDAEDEMVTPELGQLLQKVGLVNGNGNATNSETGKASVGILSKTGNRDALLYHSTPYASMLGVVLIGMGLMAYLNGWQPPKADR